MGTEAATGVLESALWAAALHSDERAFGGVFDLHRDRVYRHALRVARSRSDAEDVVATAFADLWRRRDAVRLVDGSVLPCLLVTATNHGRNHARGTRRFGAMLRGLPHSVEDDAGAAAWDRLVAGSGGEPCARRSVASRRRMRPWSC